MKKVLTIAAIVSMSASAAFAGVVVAPWFLDSGADDGVLPKDSALPKTFIRVSNTTGSNIVCTVTYRDAAGATADLTTIKNTMLVTAYGVVAWRPHGIDTGIGDSEGQGGQQKVPNSTAVGGSCRIEYTGAVGAIVGSMSSLSSAGGYGMALPGI